MKTDQQNKTTRRQLLKSAATGVALSASGALAFDKVFAATVYSGKWDLETDVLVVGFGAAGTAAAIEARTAGVEVTVIERMKTGGGAFARSGGLVYMGGGTPLQKAVGIEDSRDNMYNYLLAAVGDGANPELIGLFCDKSLELYDWLVANGVKYKKTFLPGKFVVPPTDDGLVYSGNEEQDPYSSIAKPAPRGHHPQSVGFAGHVIFHTLQKVVNSSGVNVIYEALANQLIVNSKGRITGVVITSEGRQKYIKARRGVILTTGGFGYNKEMVAQHCPAYLRCEYFVGTAGDDGSGIHMGQSVGADVRLLGDAIAYRPVYFIHETMVKGILVNDKGQRYGGEDQYGDWVGSQTALNFPNSWILIDQAIMEELPEDIKNTLEPTARAETVGELAGQLGIPGVLLEDTVEEYNQMCTNGEDLEFRKNKKFLQALDKPPFYAMDNSAKLCAFVTTGGLKVNNKAQALNTDGESIPGLYCAGAVASQVIAQHYPASGILIAQGLTFGRIAGQNAARQERT